MANKTLNVRIQNKYDTEANWASKNPVLLKGEAAYSSDKNGLYKIGNGTSKWSDLKYNSANTLVNHTSGEGFEFGYANSKTITIPKTTAVTTYYIQIAQKANFRFKNYYVKTNGNNTQYSFQAEISANAYMEPHVTLNTQKYNDSEVKSILICKNSTNSYHHDIYLVVNSSTSVAKTIYIWSDNTILDTVSTTAPTTATELNVNITNDSYIYTSKKIQANITGSAGSVAWGNITGKPSTYYTHPSYTARSSGLYKVTVDATGHVSGATAVSKADITALGIPGTDTNTWRGVQNNLTSTATDQSLSAAQGKILNETKTTRHDWNTIIKCATWSRLCYVPYSKTVVGSSFLLNIRGTRNAVVYNDTFMIKAHHSSKGNIVKISGCNYSIVSIRIVCDSSGNCYVEFFDSANGATNATTQTVYCTLIEVAVGSITKYTSFTNGTTLPTNFTVAATLTTNTNSLQGNLTWGEITGKPTTFTPSSHTHDDRYYTESEINSKLAGYLPISGGTLTGNLNLKPASGEGGEIHLDASTANRTENGIILDQQGGNFRIFGVPSADGTTKTGSGTPLVINPYSKTITGGYTLTGALSGNASTATALTTSAGSATQPIYFLSGKPVATTYQLNASVPAGAKFTDTNTWRPVENVLTSTSTSNSLSAAQGKVLKDSLDQTNAKVNNIQIGGRNLARGTSSDWSGWITPPNNVSNNTGVIASIYPGAAKSKGDTFTVSFDIDVKKFTQSSGGTFRLYLQGDVDGAWTAGNPFINYNFGSKALNGDYTEHVTYTCQLANNAQASATKFTFGYRCDYSNGTGKFRIRNLKVERGNKATDWSPAPEDYLPLNGNASTASKWATARTLTLTGSVTGSVSIDGSGNVSLATTTNHTHSQYYDSGISRAANTVLAAPNGANGTATFRKLVAADIPTLTKSKISDFPTSLAPTAGSNNYVRVYNSKDIGNSSTVTFNDLAKQHFAMGMINGATDNPYGAAKWAHGISMAWSNGANTSWISQIALGVQEGTGMWYRTKPGTIVGADWTRVLDSSNYTSYAATKGHTHSSIKDIGNGTDTTFAYSKAGMNYADYTWLAAWNGHELRAVAKSQFAQASHSHSNIISSGKKTSTASGTAANDPTKEIPLSGISMYETYSDSNTPCNYGNIINAIGSTYKGAGQLLLGWSGADSTTERMYYRNHRDMATGGWSAWKTIAWTSDIPTTLKNPSSLSIQLNGGTATVYDGSAAKSINITASSVGASVAGHTHTSTTLYSAGSRPTNINFATNTNGAGAMFHFVATSSTTTGKPPVDCNILQMNWDNNGGYDTQLALANTGDSAYLRGQHQGTWSVWKEFSFVGHTHNYAGSSSAGGAATSANKLNTNAGSATQPVYFSGGVPVACTHTLGKSVPADAKFTDTNTWRPLGTTADTACAGNDSRLSNARPASDVYAWAKASSKPSYSWGEITGKPGAFNPSSHNHRDLDAIGSVGYYGSDVANSNGWYKVYSTTLTGYNDHVARLSIVSGYNPYASGLLILHLRCNNTTSLNVQQLIWETRQGFNADDVIINTNGNTWTLYLKITNTQYGRVKIRVLESTSTVNNWSISLSNNNTKESTNPKATATAKDGAIVNYANSAGSVAWSGISGKPSLVGKTIKSLTAASSSGWSDLTSAQNLIPDMSVIAYWNGAYSNTSSNLAYCNKGAFGTIVTKNAGDYATAGHTHHYAGSSSAGGSATSAVKLDTSTAGSATQPVYFTGGKPVACTYTLGKSVPSNAVFTDTNNKMTQTAIASKDYTNWRTILWGASNSGTEGFTPTTVTDGAFTDTNLSYQPSTGTLRAKVFKGALSANTAIGSASGLETTLEFTAGEPKGTSAITQTYYLMNDFKTDYVFGVKNKSKAWISYYFGDQVYFKNSSADISALAGKMLPPVLTDFSGNKNNPGAGTGRVLSIASNVDAKIIKFRIFTSSSATTATTVNVTYSTSDIRLKDNVKDTNIKDALSVINKMKIRQFDWKDDNKHQKIGFVADELEELDDKLVVGGGWEDEEHTQMNVKGVDTFYMMGYVVKGMQELSEQIKALTEENKELKKQIEGLKREG